jgi:signal transduction histidine kinase
MSNQRRDVAKELKQWKRLLDQLAHDMASPVSFLEQFILHYTSSTKDREDDEAEVNDAALRSLNKLKDMLEHMRSFSKLTEVFFDYSDYVETIRHITAETEAMAAEHGVEISYVGPEHLLGKFDKKKVERMLANLCVNSIEAMKKKGGSLTISLSNNDKNILIEVIDNGKGIPRNSIDKIFESGFTTGKKKGTGLGLAFCRSVMEAHGGSIKVFSEDNTGTVFTLTFPVQGAIKVNKIESPVGDAVIEAILLNENSEWQKELLQMLRDAYGEKNIKLITKDFPSTKDKKKYYTLDPVRK